MLQQISAEGLSQLLWLLRKSFRNRSVQLLGTQVADADPVGQLVGRLPVHLQLGAGVRRVPACRASVRADSEPAGGNHQV